MKIKVLKHNFETSEIKKKKNVLLLNFPYIPKILRNFYIDFFRFTRSVATPSKYIL